MPKRRRRAKPKPPTRRRNPEVLTGFPLERVWHVHMRLARGERVTADSLAGGLGVSVRTIMRDLDLMRDRLGMPIDWDPAARTYWYTRECDTLPLLNIDARDALTLALVARVCETLHGWSFGRRLDAIIRKIAPVLGGAVSLVADGLDHVVVPVEGGVLDEFEHFFALFEAILGRREVRLQYVKAGSTRPTARRIHPLTLTRRQHRWALIAWEPVQCELRTYLLHRIRGIATTGGAFTPPEGIDIDGYIRGAMGAFAGGETHEVRIALDAHAAFYAREKPWHASQRLSPLPDGRIELALNLNHLGDVKHVVMGWGRHAQVIAPPELRRDVQEAHAAALGAYEPPLA